MLPRGLAAGILALLVIGSDASAEDCGPLKILASVALDMSRDDRAAFVPVNLQGQPRYMLLDTGGAFSEITPSTVTSLGLDVRKMPTVRLYDVKGNYVDHTTVVPNFAIGDLKGTNVEFVVGPDELFRYNNRIAGILGPGILRFYDVDLDFANRKLTLLSQNHCPGKVIYWKADAVATVPMQVTKVSGHIIVPVILDGQKLNALVDTGANASVLNSRVAEEDFKLPAASPGVIPLRAMRNRYRPMAYRRTFRWLAFEGVAVTNPVFHVVPVQGHQQSGEAPSGNTQLDDMEPGERPPDMLIGMDILQHLHLYIAYREQKLYITAASARIAAEPGAPTPAPVQPPGGPLLH